jgi:hypothetical protein
MLAVWSVLTTMQRFNTLSFPPVQEIRRRNPPYPGESALTLIPEGAHSAARPLTRLEQAALEEL